VKATYATTCKDNQLVWCRVPLLEGTVVIFNQSLALNSHLKGQHENLNHHYIQLSVLSNAGGLPLQERTSNGVDGTCPFCPLEATWPKITAAKTVEVNICSTATSTIWHRSRKWGTPSIWLSIMIILLQTLTKMAPLSMSFMDPCGDLINLHDVDSYDDDTSTVVNDAILDDFLFWEDAFKNM
jgi:hypothetical protein